MPDIFRRSENRKEKSKRLIRLTLLIVMVVLLATGWMTSGCEVTSFKAELIRDAVRLELKDHPKATLVDIYKNFFQDEFGPGHMIPDKQAALNYLNRELAASEGFEKQLYQPLGYKHNYYRINLSLVRNGSLPADTLLNAFVRSANSVKAPGIKQWKKEWSKIEAVIKEMNLDLESYDDDRIELLQMLDEGKYVVHHSETYIRYYDPHYRIVDRENFERLTEYME